MRQHNSKHIHKYLTRPETMSRVKRLTVIGQIIDQDRRRNKQHLQRYGAVKDVDKVYD